MFLLGLAAALVASALFNLGVALQAVEARREPKALGLRLSLLGHLLRRRLWLLGAALGLLGVGPQVIALATAPFAVVQPALAAGLLLLLAIGTRMLREPVRAPTWLGVVAIIVGVGLVAAGVPQHVEAHRGWLPVVSVVVALSLPGLLPFPFRGTRYDRPWLAMIASGSGFAATNVATKLMSDDVGAGSYPNGVLWAAVALGMGVVATLTGMTALQRLPAAMVVPVTTSLQTFFPILLEPFFLREQWSSAGADGLPVFAGLIVASAGTVLVSRTHAVGMLVSSAGSGG